ncbi:hypothetical protein BKG91_12130 [Rodentibacter caecimuris]|uniref:phage regulatory CII family protein n=1 Tax=Rodentibacter caecimuris TaxID=1796644 RepID=UPI0007516A23|nr:phage regulatory CII family protein [Rodentibacter heylii]AOF53694.1 hypothetical protein AC062_1602 [Pasteurellaceae bacterium NI1060]OOF69985.1 hypothetical protein BKG91_12130 [Rodentibacter heylii]
MKENESPFAYVQQALHVQLASSRNISNFAPTLGKAESQLAQELNPDYPRNKLGFIDAIHLISLTGSVNIVEMIAQSVDCTLMPKPKCGSNSTDLLRDVARLSATVGKLCGDTAEAVSADSDLGYEVSAKERDKLMESVEHLLSQLVCLKQVLGQ